MLTTAPVCCQEMVDHGKNQSPFCLDLIFICFYFAHSLNAKRSNLKGCQPAKLFSVNKALQIKVALIYKHQNSLNSLNLIKTNTNMRQLETATIFYFHKSNLRNIFKSWDAIKLAAFNIPRLLRETDQPIERRCTVRKPET